MCFLTLALCKSVFSMMVEKARMKHVSGLTDVSTELHDAYLSANSCTERKREREREGGGGGGE